MGAQAGDQAGYQQFGQMIVVSFVGVAGVDFWSLSRRIMIMGKKKSVHKQGTPSKHPEDRKGLRHLAEPYILPGPEGCSTRGRLLVSEQDGYVLREYGRYMGHLCNVDLVRMLGGGVDSAARRNLLTESCSSRLAHSAVSYVDQLVHSAQASRARHINSLRRAIIHMVDRLAAPVKASYAEGEPQPYPNPRVHGQKLVRLNAKRQLLAKLEGEARAEIASRTTEIPAGVSRLHIVRGGHDLWEMRQNLAAAKTTESAWRERWDAARMFIRAIGSRDEGFGNSTIQVDPEKGTCRILLPPALRYLSNTPNGKYYILDARVKFHHREQEWLGRIWKHPTGKGANGAVAYTISYRPERRRRWYIDASWAYKAGEKAAAAGVSTVGVVTGDSNASDIATEAIIHTPANSRIIAVDLNADHIAAWVIDEHGNPVGRPYHIPLYLKGLSAGKREGHVRWAISQLIHIAIDERCRFIACEDLGWADETGRDEPVQGPAFRHTISGMPTSLFKKSLSAMARRSGLSVVAVDPAYTSQWGAEFWQKPRILPNNIETTVHESASIVIGRTSQDRSAYRAARGTQDDRIDRPGNTTADGRAILAGVAAEDRAIGARAPMAESG